MLSGVILVGSASLDDKDALDFDKVVSEQLSDDAEVQRSALSELEYRGNSVLPILPTLIEVIKRANRENRIDALHILADFHRHAKAAVKPIDELLADSDVAVRMAAADALLKVDGRNDAAIALLTDALRGADEKDRITAARMLGDAAGSGRPVMCFPAQENVGAL